MRAGDTHHAAYEHSPELTFVFGDQVIHGWDALRAQQLQWCQNGKSDAVYALVGAPEYVMPALGVLVQTYVLDTRRAGPDAAQHGAQIGVTDVWRQGATGWRVIYAHESLVTH